MAVTKAVRSPASRTRTKVAAAPQPGAVAAADAGPLKLGELSELLGYVFKRAQLRIFEDFIRCVEPLQLTPAQFSVLVLLEHNPGRNQTEIATTLGILRPNFVAMLDGLESRELCVRVRSTQARQCRDPPARARGGASRGAAPRC